MKIDYQDLFEAKVHLGHQKCRWNPNFKQFIYKHLNGISVIDLEKTYQQLERSCEFLTEKTQEGAKVLFVGTKQQAKDTVKDIAQRTNMPFCVSRWLGGCLTNFSTIQKSLKKYKKLLSLESKGEIDKMHKKEGSAVRRTLAKMERDFEGIADLTSLPDVMFVIDAKAEAIAIHEARKLKIPVVAIVDTNSDPTIVDYPIPANDDATKSIDLIMDFIREAIENGLENKKLKAASNKKDLNKFDEAVAVKDVAEKTKTKETVEKA